MNRLLIGVSVLALCTGASFAQPYPYVGGAKATAGHRAMNYEVLLRTHDGHQFRATVTPKEMAKLRHSHVKNGDAVFLGGMPANRNEPAQKRLFPFQ